MWQGIRCDVDVNRASTATGSMVVIDHLNMLQRESLVLAEAVRESAVRCVGECVQYLDWGKSEVESKNMEREKRINRKEEEEATWIMRQDTAESSGE